MTPYRLVNSYKHFEGGSASILMAPHGSNSFLGLFEP